MVLYMYKHLQVILARNRVNKGVVAEFSKQKELQQMVMSQLPRDIYDQPVASCARIENRDIN